MAITKEVRRKLLKILPNNYRVILSDQERVHPQTIGNCLYGRTENKKIEIAILLLAKQNKEVIDRETTKSAKIIRQISEV